VKHITTINHVQWTYAFV